MVVLLTTYYGVCPVTALISLKENWSGTPLNWEGTDPCGDQWDGITCQENRIVSM